MDRRDRHLRDRAPPSPDHSDAEAERRAREEASERRRRSGRAPADDQALSEPRYVMLRSALIPGWGQLHNGSWFKAIGVAAGEIGIRRRDLATTSKSSTRLSQAMRRSARTPAMKRLFEASQRATTTG